MLFHEQSEDYRPLFWLRGHPIYAHTFLIILHVVAFVATAIALALWGGDVLQEIALIPYLTVWHGEIWRLVTYVTFQPSLWFVFAMGFLYFAGKEVEQFVGRTTFLKLYIGLVVIPAVVVCLVNFLVPMSGHLNGTESVFGVFVAFATIYPGVVLNIWFVNLTTKAWAWVLLAVYTLIDFSGHSWTSMLILWTSAGVGYFGMRLIGAGRGMEWLTDWIEERRAQKLARERNFKIVKERQANESTDAILEKISKQGVASLTPSERAALERARTNLLKRDQR